jgi:hypothetical protein
LHQTPYRRHVTAIPVELRATIARELDRLVRGELPALLVWVNNDGSKGAALIQQPDEI